MLIMDLDMSRKKADMQGSTTRADGVRTPLMEIILDEITYDTDMLSPFLKVFNEPKWKLEIILQYFSKYTPDCPPALGDQMVLPRMQQHSVES
uniref:Uncharacterized protein n=1 Tax=Salix viminalis TaxID=40686 RepID=A0A6N2KEH3_SALVM